MRAVLRIIWLPHINFIHQPTRIQIFEGKEFEDRINAYYDQDENDNKMFRAFSSKLAALISFWYFSEKPTQKEFDAIIDDLSSE